MEYKKRIADQMLADKLESAGAVLVEGPKYCGKTTLSKQQAKSVLSMDIIHPVTDPNGVI